MFDGFDDVDTEIEEIEEPELEEDEEEIEVEEDEDLSDPEELIELDEEPIEEEIIDDLDLEEPEVEIEEVKEEVVEKPKVKKVIKEKTPKEKVKTKEVKEVVKKEKTKKSTEPVKRTTIVDNPILQFIVDQNDYQADLDNIVRSKVNEYNKILKLRQQGKTSKIPSSKTITKTDIAKLLKSKLMSDTKYMTTFVKLFHAAGMDKNEAMQVIVKDKFTNIFFVELLEFFEDMVTDVLMAEGAIQLINNDNISLSLNSTKVNEFIQPIGHLARSKYTHLRKSDFYKVSCRSKVSAGKIDRGHLDAKGNFVKED